MKLSNRYIKTAFKITEIATGKRYDCFLQNINYYGGENETLFNIGINGYNEWNFICYVNEADFNKLYTID